MRGAWIEITERTLNDSLRMSLPMRGAWIEITRGCAKSSIATMSLPMRGAWIEITLPEAFAEGLVCRSPCGERGLKSHLVQSLVDPMVAPHAGSVD